MSSETASLLGGAVGDNSTMQMQVLAVAPDFGRFSEQGRYIVALSGSEGEVAKQQALANLQPSSVLQVMDSTTHSKYMFTVLVEVCRENTSNYDKFTAALPSVPMVDKMLNALKSSSTESYTADKIGYFLTALMAHEPDYFGDASGSDEDAAEYEARMEKVLQTTRVVMSSTASQLGKLEALSNLLKVAGFRKAVVSCQSAVLTLTSVNGKAPSACLYRAAFCYWLLSGSPSVLGRGEELAERLREFLTESRSEKVIRVCLLALKNYLMDKTMCGFIVEAGTLPAVQQLEYEKWRDVELYAEIKDVAALISSEQSTHSNYDRYVRELESGAMKPGSVHSERFWLDNVKKFEADNFSAIRRLVAYIADPNVDPTTLCLAIRDLGEFARLHPFGKMVIQKVNAKPPVMHRMQNQNREVAREALLCVQKMMLTQASLTQMEK
jgi:V-type H+-transporting ATPase subunit H